MNGNIGEWSEIYIFLKLMYDRKVYAADKDMNKINDVFLSIIKIIREEFKNQVYEYYTGDSIKIHLNDTDTGLDIPAREFRENKDKLFNLMLTNASGTFGSSDIERFLGSIYITKLKAPAFNKNEFFGGTQDITMSVNDYKSGIISTVGFSCKSDFGGRATLFNASKDNTNFIYEITGAINDSVMDNVNSLFIIRGGSPKTAIQDRIRLLKETGCDLKFVSPCTQAAERNLVLSGGNELPVIVGNALKHYYWDNVAPISNVLEYIIESNPAKYNFDDTESIYKRKFSDLLYNMFTGMRLGKSWDGRSNVNGGYIVMKNNGDVLAYHSCIADEFKDFLLNKLAFETPSASRHDFMQIYKEQNKYYMKLNLQVRFI
ncbi:MAG: HpaII family restriction endonuclease [Defluviitaleaceae bacterium]|nr:HpaII family restriction endonuclease [Defluviitaleaceae bacterium]